ncbi:hypothetical protein [Clostridium saccharoperbutylacetonicum]|uniref:hypothetical protein n=1 Tax=Clostridium saccharoperbutylacetonicum TaxID=36745 RepID=UPI0039ED7EA2
MEFIMTARNKEQENIDYLPLREHGLKASVDVVGGNGSIKNPFQVKVVINNENKINWSGVIHLELKFNKVSPRYFMPAFMYGRNRGECPQNVPNEFPRLREEIKRPSSPSWMVRSDRLSHPVVLVHDSNKIYGFCASPYFINKNGIKQQWKPEVDSEFYQYAGYTCSLEKGTIGYTLGYENAPWLFIKSHDVRERTSLSENCFELEPGEIVEVAMDIYEFDAKSELDINPVIEEVYYRYHQKPRKASDIKTTVADLSMAVYQDAWLQEDSSYSGQVFEDKNSGEYRYNKIISITWTNGLSVATPMLMAALRLENEYMREQALDCITNIVEHSLNPITGLPFGAYDNGKWSNYGWWFDGMHTPGHSSYLIGQSLFYILKAYDYEIKLKNCHHDEWLTVVNSILMKIEKTKNTDNEYPFILSERTGAGIEYDSFSGTWCMAALAYYCYLTGDKSHLYSLMKSERHYYETYIKHMECYGGPLDTDKATDSEGILAYIKATRYIHALTGEKIYLQHMKDAIGYEFSFKFCYNSPIKVPPLSKINWSSCGGSVTSIANPHIHPMSSNIVDELLYLVENTEDKYVKARMLDTIGWGCQTYNTYDKEFDYGKKGWMSERFCHSQGLLSERYSDGSLASTWFCLMPWASGSIIEGLAGDFWEVNQKVKMD